MKSIFTVVLGVVAGCLLTLLLSSRAAELRDQQLLGHVAALQMLKADEARKASDAMKERIALESVVSTLDAKSDALGTRTFAWSLLTPFVTPTLHAIFGSNIESDIARTRVAATAKLKLKTIKP